MTVAAHPIPSVSHEASSGRARRSVAATELLCILPAFAICLLVCFWFITWGNGHLFVVDRFGDYYDAQARAMLHGHLDVPPEAIGYEAFERDGKFYGYFGITPALLRIPFLLLAPQMDGMWSRLATLVACFLNLVYAKRLLTLARRGDDVAKTSHHLWHDWLFLLAVGIGSTNLFIISRSFTFHEAIMWGSTFALMAGYYLIRYLEAGQIAAIGLAGLCALLAFLSRPTAGAGAILAVGLTTLYLLYQSIRTRSRVNTMRGLLACGIVACGIGIFCGINYAKFGTFQGVPLKYYLPYAMEPRRMELTGGSQIHAANLPTGIAAYFGVAGFDTNRAFPWIYLTQRVAVLPGSAIDIVEPHSSIPVSMPALFLLACFGGLAIARKGNLVASAARLPAAGLLIGASVVLVTVGITQRYLHDFFPVLVLAGAFGMAELERRKGSANSAALRTAVLTLLVLLSVGINCAFAFDYQAEIAKSAPPDQHQRLEHIRAMFGKRGMTQSALSFASRPRYSGGGLGRGSIYRGMTEDPHPNPPPEYRERELAATSGLLHVPVGERGSR